MPYQGRTKVSELKDLILIFGGKPKGSTFAQLQDELEHAIEKYVDEGGSGGGSGIETGGLSDDDIQDIFDAIGIDADGNLIGDDEPVTEGGV